MLSKFVAKTKEMLPAELFERVHSPTLVNTHFTDRFIMSDCAYIIINHGDEPGVSKTKKDQLLLRLGIR